mgnify:FL=1
MKVNIHGKNKFVVKPALREYIEKQIMPIGEMFRLADSVTANVVCKEYGDTKIVEVTIPTKYLIMRAESEADDMFKALDNAVDKLEKQLQRHKKKINSFIKKRDGIGNYFSEVESQQPLEEKKVVKEKMVDLPIMTVDEAIIQLELLDHEFYMFINEEDHKPTTIYLRNDGNYAVIRSK